MIQNTSLKLTIPCFTLSLYCFVEIIAGMDKEKIIEVSHLAKHYGSFKAVKAVSFDVYPGDVFGFLGPNGASKSTSLRCLLSLIKPTAGQIQVFAYDIQHHREAILSRIGCIIEKPDFYKYLSARRNLEVLSRISAKKITKARIDEILEQVGLSDRSEDKLAGFSHGMIQRLGVAQALIHDPDLIILYEPTTGLDPQGVIGIRNLILHLSHDLGKTVVLSSHVLSEIEIIANRMVIIDQGNTIVHGVVAELLDQKVLVVQIEVSDVNTAASLLGSFNASLKISISNDHELQLNIKKEDIPAINHLLTNNGIEVFAIQARRQLEDLFLNLTAH